MQKGVFQHAEGLASIHKSAKRNNAKACKYQRVQFFIGYFEDIPFTACFYLEMKIKVIEKLKWIYDCFVYEHLVEQN